MTFLMLYILLPIYSIFIGIGGIGNYLAVRNKPLLEKKQSWLKFRAYSIWVIIILIGTLFFTWFYKTMAFAVIIIGFIEINKRLNFKSNKDFIILALFSIIAIGYIFFSFLDNYGNDKLYTLMFTLICICDAFSQITGQLLGKIKILKRISPNKTLEGLIGGILIMALTSWFFLKNERVGYDSVWLFFATLVAVGAPIGDILSSSLKRYFGIKDFGNYFPGQGGVLDRYDSHIFTGALFYFVVTFQHIVLKQ